MASFVIDRLRRLSARLANGSAAQTSGALETGAMDVAAAVQSGPPSAEELYQARLKEERQIYDLCTNVHNLPQIFHYWSDRYVRPKLEAFGFSHPNALFGFAFAERLRRAGSGSSSFASVGSGNCQVEIAVARELSRAGFSHFTIECVDLNPEMLNRGRELAAAQGVSEHLLFTEADFNYWQPQRQYDGVMANQSLHHVSNLEGLFEAVKKSLAPGGVFVTSDMIGRNGHQRWPEALEIVQEIWRTLPGAYRMNRQLKRYEEVLDNWDCSTEGFEGVRAQEVLPLLISHFQFELFIAFANIIDPFVDRSFGHNFIARAEWDRAFIDQVHHRDEEEMLKGTIKPTHMLAVMKNEPCELRCHPPFTPEFCVRPF